VQANDKAKHPKPGGGLQLSSAENKKQVKQKASELFIALYEMVRHQYQQSHPDQPRICVLAVLLSLLPHMMWSLAFRLLLKPQSFVCLKNPTCIATATAEQQVAVFFSFM
jgi:hypothetical protein